MAQYSDNKERIDKANQKWRTKNKTKRAAYMHQYRIDKTEVCNNYYRKRRAEPLSYFYITVRGCIARAKKHNLACTIKPEDLVQLFDKQERKCAISGREMILNLNGGRDPNRVSIDRIDRTQGYELHNIRLVCFWVNTARSEWSDEVLLDWCRVIVERHNVASPNIS
jgi:hypothetical protein